VPGELSGGQKLNGGDKFSVTSPVGGAGSRIGDDVESLIARADASLQESIAKGGNRVTVLS